MKKYFYILFAFIACFACTIIESPTTQPNDNIRNLNSRNEGNCKVVSYSFTEPDFLPERDADSLHLFLTSKYARENVYSFWMAFNRENDTLHCTLYLPLEGLPLNGTFRLERIEDALGNVLFVRQMITLRGNIITDISSSTFVYQGLQGDGTSGNPYIIADVLQLTTFSRNLQDDPEHAFGLYFSITGDLDFNKYYEDPTRYMDEGWCGIGNGFAGYLNGNGHTLSALKYSNQSMNSIGLFKSLLHGAVITDLQFDKVNIANAGQYVGVVAGETTGEVTLRNITVSGTLKATATAGGLVGLARKGLKVINCNNEGLQVNTSAQEAGGLVGSFQKGDGDNLVSLIDSCSSDGNVLGTQSVGGIVGSIGAGCPMTLSHIQVTPMSIVGDSYCGGIVGKTDSDITLQESRVYHSASGTYQENIIGKAATDHCGGFVGLANQSLTIKNSEVCTPVSGHDGVGGVVGTHNEGTVSLRNVKNSSASKLVGHQYVGGLVGSSTNLTLVDTSANHSFVQHCNVEATAGYVGGIVGRLSGGKLSMTNIYIAANVTGNGYYVGGAAGLCNELIMERCSFLNTMEVNGPNDVGGVVGRLLGGSLTPDMFSTPFAIKVNNSQQQMNNAVSVGGLCGSASRVSFNGLSLNCSVFGKTNVGGFVGYDDYGTYYNCTTEGAEVNGKGECTGGIVGKVASRGASLTYLTNESKVIGNLYTGGAVGYLVESSISLSTNIESVTGGENTGGVVGYMMNSDNSSSVEISFCSNEGTVSSNQRALGGICGYAKSKTSGEGPVNIYQCRNTGTVSGSGTDLGGNAGMAGILGEGQSSIIIRNCANKGDVHGMSGFKHIGGIAGYLCRNSHGYENYVHISECYNSGDVRVTSTTNGTFVGGIAGHLEDAATTTREVIISDCYNMGTVSANSSSGDHAGGIMGKASFYITLKRCYSAGYVYSSGSGTKLSNGIVGTHADGEVLYGSRDNLYTLKGTGKDWWGSYFDESDKGNQSTYKNFNFDSVFMLSSNSNNGFPYLRNTPL